MKVFFALTYDTGDGMEPGLFLARSLEEIRQVAISHLRHPEDEKDEDEGINHSIESIESWDGSKDIEVFYFDGNPGKMLLGTSEL